MLASSLAANSITEKGRKKKRKKKGKTSKTRSFSLFPIFFLYANISSYCSATPTFCSVPKQGRIELVCKFNTDFKGAGLGDGWNLVFGMNSTVFFFSFVFCFEGFTIYMITRMVVVQQHKCFSSLTSWIHGRFGSQIIGFACIGVGGNHYSSWTNKYPDKRH